MKDIRVLLVDDHQVVRDGLRMMLRPEEDIKIVGQGSNGEEAMSQVEALSPDVILMDIKMPGVDGIELTQQVKQKHPTCNIIMLTLYDEYLSRAMEAGASGYLLKDIAREELAEAIRRVNRGEIVITRSITARARLEYEEIYGEKAEKSDSSLFQEIQLIILPPVDANQLMKFTERIENKLQARVLQIIGFWKEGMAVTIVLPKAKPLEDILAQLRGLIEIKTTEEELVLSEINPRLLEKIAALPKPANRPRKTILGTLIE